MTSSNSELNAYGLATPESWWNTTLEEVCSGDGGLIQTGPFGSQLHAHDYREEGIPVVMPKQLGDNMISTEGIARISDEDVERLSRHKLREGDIVFSRRGDVTRRSYITKDEEGWLCGTGCMLIRPSHEKLLNDFLALFFSLPQFKDYITLNAVGATMPNLNTKILQNIPLFLPSRSTQHKIVAVISAYDDLIENNTRRIAILEEMAQAIYREWFVNFRFPGHENVKLVDSPLGQIPEGWEVVRVKSLLKRLKASRQYKQADVTEEGTVPVIDQSTAELLGFHDNEPDFEASSTTPVVIFGDHTCKMELMTTPFSIGPNVVPFVSKTEHPVGFVFFVVKSLVSTQEYKRHWTTLNNKEICLSPAEVADDFVDFITPIVEAVNLFRNKNRNLRMTRDLLLPKLISGKLDIEYLDIEIGLANKGLQESTA